MKDHTSFILIPDSFKGTMSSQTVCGVMESAIHVRFPSASVKSIPIADGGEGTVDALLTAAGGSKQALRVSGPYFDVLDSFYGILSDKTAVIEMAACAGLPLVGEKLHPDQTTTYGVGELIANAVSEGCTKVLLGLGGSATNDGGCGMAAALGVKFYNSNGDVFVPVGGTLKDICRIDDSEFKQKYSSVQFTAMCDIDNPLCGEHGAAAVFGPQKGADEAMVRLLDDGLYHLAQLIRRDLHRDVLNLSGAGAAGGMGGGTAGLLGGSLQSGINSILEIVRFDELVQSADCVFTGEGRIDSQSLRGKVIAGVASHTHRYHVPLIAVVGCIGDDISAIYERGVSAVFTINTKPQTLRESAPDSCKNLALTMDNILRLLSL